jgi:hypothetical protein
MVKETGLRARHSACVGVLLNQLADFHEIWYRRHTNAKRYNHVLVNVIESLMTAMVRPISGTSCT